MTIKQFDWSIHDYSPHGICLFHVELDDKGRPEDFTFAYCNPVLAKMTGYTREALTGKRFFLLYPNEDRKWLDCYYKAAYQNQYQEMDVILDEIDQYLHIEAVPTGEDGYCLCILRNIREEIFEKNRRKRELEDTLEQERMIQKRLKQALDEANLKNEIISSISKSYCRIFRVDIQRNFFEEISASEDDEVHHLTGRSGSANEMGRLVCDTSVAEEYRPLLREFLNVKTLPERLKNEEYISTEYRMCDGNWHTLRYIVKKRDAKGTVTHVLCTIRSISDTKRREQDLHFAAEAAKREAQMKTRFLATMSHDIRTPLNGIIGMINLEEQYADVPAMQKTIRAKTRESLQYLVSLVNDVLDMNKIQSGDLTSRDVPFDLVDILQRSNQRYAARAAKKRIRYVVKWDNDAIVHPYLVGNPIYLGRILANIADNAVKFSNPESTITVGLEEKPLTEEGKDRVLLTFYCKDEGIGMSEELVKHAFDMFTQGNTDSGRTKYQGSGLGLAIAKQLADRMGGSIELQSEPGVGTTAITRIPFQIGTGMESMSREEDLGEISIKGLRALVVEDNELNMEIVCEMLKQNGLEVTCAADGQEAVEIFTASAPGYFGVIYMDIMMPRMNGMDATRAIRAMRRSDARQIPIIAMSANTFAEDIIGCRLAGMNRHLSKPLDAADLIEALKQCIAENETTKLREEL